MIHSSLHTGQYLILGSTDSNHIVFRTVTKKGSLRKAPNFISQPYMTQVGEMYSVTHHYFMSDVHVHVAIVMYNDIN